MIFVGKPLLKALTVILIIILYLLQITGWVIKLRFPKFSFGLPRKKLKNTGIVFSSNWLKIKILILVFKKNLENLLSSVKKSFKESQHKSRKPVWKTEVFFLAVEKIFHKLEPFGKFKLSRFQLQEIAIIYLLKGKLKLVYLLSFGLFLTALSNSLYAPRQALFPAKDVPQNLSGF